jgi:hypothetical protein
MVEKGHRMRGQRIASTAFVVMVGVTGVAAPATPAAAVGGDCQAEVEKKVRDWRPDLYRPAAYCSSLQADSKARGLLDITAVPDPSTPWFTQLKVWKYGTWEGQLGVRGAYTEIRAV